MAITAPDAGPSPVIDATHDPLATAIPETEHYLRSGTLPSVFDRSVATRAAIKAGVLGVFVGMIPFLGIVLTGALAVYFYKRDRGLVLPAALGGRLGGAAGVVAFAINAVLITIRIFVFHAGQEYVDFLSRFAQAIGANPADPEIQTSLHNMLTPSGLAITFFFGMVIAVVLASIGGAVASLVMRPRDGGM